MKLLKVLLLSSSFLLVNCSLVNDKFFSKSKKNNEQAEEQIAVSKNEKENDLNIVDERIFIEDKEEKYSKNNEGLQGDVESSNIEEYPNLANVPNRPDKAISFDEQKEIIKDLENNTQLEPVPSDPVTEMEVAELEPKFNTVEKEIKQKKQKLIKSNKETNDSIRNILSSKLEKIDGFKPKNAPNFKVEETAQEKELHDLARNLKNIKTKDEVIKVEEKIKKNDLYYTPQDIENILGLKMSYKQENNSNQLKKESDLIKKAEIKETTIIEKKKIEEREIPVARVTFNHGSSHLSGSDLSKIKQVAELFIQNEGKKIVIVGHSSSRTNYDMDLTKHALVNFNISLERARIVMKEFSTIGLNSQKIELVAMSDSNPLYAEIMPSLEAANRRAEIFIQY
ncbi:MAG: hypothetical protein CFH25_00024 [Alphaproteobacteria bacterium MarineAlpha6_Bin3]|nr:MAG: hypothetical protein CFH25_00024 [Alphaproteobacteria bacterium MarineAlpha6_Bin3]